MYLTTHRVESMTAPRERAVHGFLYIHKEDLELSPELFDEITRRSPGGELVESYTPGRLRPGGNAVLSYLDIVSHDEIDPTALERFLSDFATQIAGASLPQTLRSEECWLRFHISNPTYGDQVNAVEEFQSLKEAALQILAQRTK